MSRTREWHIFKARMSCSSEWPTRMVRGVICPSNARCTSSSVVVTPSSMPAVMPLYSVK